MHNTFAKGGKNRIEKKDVRFAHEFFKKPEKRCFVNFFLLERMWALPIQIFLQMRHILVDHLYLNLGYNIEIKCKKKFSRNETESRSRFIILLSSESFRNVGRNWTFL